MRNHNRNRSFDTELAVVSLPGRVIAEAVAYSRAQPALTSLPNPGLIHCDPDVTVVSAPDNKSHQLTHINGRPMQPDQMYKVQ